MCVNARGAPQGDVAAPWAVVCTPLWLLHALSFCALVPYAGARGDALWSSLGIGVVSCALGLSTAVMLVMLGDGAARHSLTSALSPAFAALFMGGTYAIFRLLSGLGKDERLRRRPCARAAVLAATFFSCCIVFVFVLLTPLRVAQKVDGSGGETPSWSTVLFPGTIVVAMLAAYATIRARALVCWRPQDYRIPGTLTYVSRVQGSWARANTVVPRM